MLSLGSTHAPQQPLVLPMGKLSPCGLRRLVSLPRVYRAQSAGPSPRCLSDDAPVAPSPAPARSSPWLLVGIGNPGSKYEGTRHNVGFQMIDVISRAEGITLSTIQFKSLLGKGKIGDASVLLAKPQTYMNLSGEAVKPLASYYKIPPERVLTIYDDLDLEFATMKLLSKGGHGGHNGMRSIINHLGSRNSPRLRIGIGRPPGTMDPRAYVLQKFSSGEKEEVDYALNRALDAMRLITTQGIEKAVSTWNQIRKSKVAKMAYSDIKLD